MEQKIYKVGKWINTDICPECFHPVRVASIISNNQTCQYCGYTRGRNVWKTISTSKRFIRTVPWWKLCSNMGYWEVRLSKDKIIKVETYGKATSPG